MKTEEVECLLLAISDKENDSRVAEVAFTELYRAYSKFLHSVLSKAIKDMGICDDHIANTIVNNTFFKIFNNPLVFSFPNGASTDGTFKAWLCKVAKNELLAKIDEFYDKKRFISLDRVNAVTVFSTTELDEELIQTVNHNELEKVLNILSDRDRHILMTLYMYFEKGKKTPSDVISLLCDMHNVTEANIRKIKERSEKKIVEYFSKRNILKPIKNGR